MRRLGLIACLCSLWTLDASARLLECNTGKAVTNYFDNRPSNNTNFTRTRIDIEINSKRIMRQLVSCINAEFIYDLTPCAPNGFISLSSGSGSSAGSIAEFTKRDQEMFDWTGGHTRFWEDKREIFFGGGFYPRETWAVRVDKVTGSGVLRLSGDKYSMKEWYPEDPKSELVVELSCRRARAKL